MFRQLGYAALAAMALAACEPSTPKSVDVPAVKASPVPAPVVSSVPDAAEPAFVGAWAADAASCALAVDDPDAPMDITAKGYDQFEAHCDFETVTPVGANEWAVTGRCMTAINQNGAFKIKVEGDTLTMSSDHGAITQVRCPKA